MSDKGQKVTIITGGCQGIGASLVTAYRPSWRRPQLGPEQMITVPRYSTNAKGA